MLCNSFRLRNLLVRISLCEGNSCPLILSVPASLSQLQLFEDASSVESYLAAWWRKPTTELDLSIHDFRLQQAEVEISIGFARYSDNFTDPGPGETAWSPAALNTHSLSVSNVRVSAQGPSSPVIDGVDLLHLSWVKNLVAGHRAAQDQFSALFPKAALDLSLSSEGNARLSVSHQSAFNLIRAASSLLEPFRALRLPPAPPPSLESFSIDLGSTTFSRSVATSLVTKFETSHLSVNFHGEQGAINILSLSNPTNSNRSPIALSARIPNNVVENQPNPTLHFSSMSLHVHLSAPLLSWMSACQSLLLSPFRQESLPVPSPRVEQPSIEAALPVDFPATLIALFSDQFSFHVRSIPQFANSVAYEPLLICSGQSGAKPQLMSTCSLSRSFSRLAGPNQMR